MAYGTVYSGGTATATVSKLDKRTKAYRDMENKYSSDAFEPEVAEVTSVSDKENESGSKLNIPRMSMGGRVTRSGSLGGNQGAISVQVPYVIINRPRLSLPANYGHYHGYPSNITETLGNLKGYTRVSDIHLENIPATSSELDIIDSYLKNGVIINSTTHTDPLVFTLYNNKSDMNTINKDLASVTTCDSIVLKQPTSVVNPTFVLSGVSAANILASNYIYYPGFAKYYFIRNKVSTATDVWELQCEVDAIETYRTEILAQTAVISRQEFKYNLYLDDGSLKAYSDPMIQVKKFPTSFNSQGTTYVMVVIGQ